MNYKHFRRSSISIVCVIALSLCIDNFSKVFDVMETLSVDWRYNKWNATVKPSDKIVIVDIDDESLKFLAPEFGAWPWPRSAYKNLLEYLAMSGPKSVLFDILFTEPQREKINDEMLAEASKLYPGISHAVKFLDSQVVESNNKPRFDSVIEKQSIEIIEADTVVSAKTQVESSKDASRNRFDYDFQDFLIPNPVLLQKEPDLHIVNAIKDRDGIFRRGLSIFSFQNKYYPGLAVKGLLSLMDSQSRKVLFDEKKGIISFSPEGWKLPVDSKGQVVYRFYSEETPFKIVPFAQIALQKDKIDKGLVDDPAKLDPNPLEFFKDKVVLVGSSAIGLEDLKATPINKSLPGVILHATTISNVLQNDFVTLPSPLTKWIVTVFILLAVYFSIFYFESVLIKFGISIGVMALYFGSALYLFKFQQLQIAMAIPLILAIVGVLDAFVYMTFIEGQQKKQMLSTLSKFLSPEVALEMVKNGIDPTAEIGRRKELTILFSDIRGFTAMSEKYEAEKLVSILNCYLGKMTDVVFEKKGTLDKFIGDAVMAFWGAPIENPDHAKLAVESSLKMIQELKALNVEFKANFNIELNIGIGINTGSVVVGNIGSEKRLDYTVIGDNVNLASRLEGLTKQYRLNIIVGEDTYEKTKTHFFYREVDFVVVKGKDEPIRIYEPLCYNSERTSELEQFVLKFELGLKSYRDGNFELAENQFNVVAKLKQDGPTQVFLERIMELKSTRPLNWTGTYIAKSK